MNHYIQDAVEHETVMDVTEEQIARVYAQAFLGAANKNGKGQELTEELESLVKDVLNKFPALEDTLGSHVVPNDQKEGIIDRVLKGRASEEVLNFVKVLFAHGRMGILRAVERQVHHMYSEQSGRVEIQLTVANPLEEPLRSEVATALGEAVGADPELTIFVDPDLIAGFVVKIGDTVYDGSVKTRFEQARRTMIANAVEKIETKPETLFNGE